MACFRLVSLALGHILCRTFQNFHRTFVVCVDQWQPSMCEPHPSYRLKCFVEKFTLVGCWRTSCARSFLFISMSWSFSNRKLNALFAAFKYDIFNCPKIGTHRHRAKSEFLKSHEMVLVPKQINRHTKITYKSITCWVFVKLLLFVWVLARKCFVVLRFKCFIALKVREESFEWNLETCTFDHF